MIGGEFSRYIGTGYLTIKKQIIIRWNDHDKKPQFTGDDRFLWEFHVVKNL